MSWKCPSCDSENKNTKATGDTALCPACGVATPLDSWAMKCAWLGKVIASNQNGAFALNKTTRQVWLATPEEAMEPKMALRGDVRALAMFLNSWWQRYCKGPCPLSEENISTIWNTING